MKRVSVLSCVAIASVLSNLLTTSVQAEELQRLGDRDRPATTVAEWLAQNQPASSRSKALRTAQTLPTQVTGVQLNPTPDGLTITLETGDGKPLEGTTTRTGKSLYIEIPNAQLQLVDGKEFQKANPIAGIAAVTVSALDATRIRITVTGTNEVPEATLTQSAMGLAIAITPLAVAEDSEEPEEEIVVTAQKRSESLQNVPLSITAIPRQQLEDAQVDSFRDVAGLTPNFSFFRQGSGGIGSAFYSIRGVGNSNIFSPESVAFYLDEIPLDSGRFVDLNLIDLEQVEVLRGPQSTLYGRNSSAGVVNITTRPPTNSPEIRAAASYGNYNFRDLQLSLSDAVIPDKLAFRLAGAYTARDGFARNVLLDQNTGERSNLTGRAQLLWTPAKEWRISFNVLASYTDDGDSAFSIASDPDPFRIERDINGFNQVSTNAQALKIAYDGAGLQATSITSRRFSNQDYATDGDITALPLARYFNQFNSTVWTQEIRLQSPKTAEQFRWLLGGYFESFEFNTLGDGFTLTDLGAAAFGLPFPGTDRASGELRRNTYAVFGQVAYQPIQPLTLTAGLRYEANRTRLDRRRNFELANGVSFPIGQTVNGAEQNSDEVIPRFAAQYRFNPNLMVYASIARGYKPGGLNYRADSLALLQFEEEKSWTYEAGLKSSWLDNRLSVNFAVFNTQFDNYQVALPDLSGQFRNIFNADAKVTGFELEMRAEPVKGLSLTAGLGYLDSQFKNYLNPQTGQRFDGNQLPYAPNLTYNLSAQYRSAGGFLGRVELQGFGTYFFDDANEVKQTPFAIVNARLGYEGKNFGVYLFANNLLDTRYVNSAFLFPPNIVSSYGDPVTYGIQVKASF
jgi:iron complex outermembrane receptor protein